MEKLTCYVIYASEKKEGLRHFLQCASDSHVVPIPAVTKEQVSLLGNSSALFNLKKAEELLERTPNNKEIAHTLSHIHCWKVIAENEQLQDNDFALIAESEIQPVENFIQHAIGYANKYSSYGIIKLQHDGDARSGERLFQAGDGPDALIYGDTNQYNYGGSLYLIRKNVAKKLTALLSEKAESKTESAEKPDIVVCLQESTLNPHQFDFDAETIPPFSMFNKQEDTAFVSPLRVHTVGGATWKSEFAFLAGVPSTDFGALASGVFYSVVPHLQTGFIKNLREQGYFCVALSPFTKGNYNAKPAYDHFGFDLMLQPQDLGYPASISKNLWHISSEEMMYYTKLILQKQHPSLKNVQQPMFVYVLTMKEHGPYNTNMPNHFNLASKRLGGKAISCLNDYIDRIDSLNEAIEGLNDYLKSRETPYVFGYFGDHQVAFDNQLPPKKGNFVNPDYVTQFVVRTNRKTDFVQQQDFLDLAFVGGVLLDVAGLSPKDDFMRANIAMRQLSQGKLEDAEDMDLVNSYRNYLYQDLKIAQ